MIEHLQPLIQHAVTRTYRPGSTILFQGEAPRMACVLVKGVVRVFSISSQGDEQIVMFHVAGEFFPSSWIFNNASSTLFFYEAMTSCDVVNVARKDLIEHMYADPERTQALLHYFTTNYAASLIRVNALEQPRARDKLVYTLYYLCQLFSNKSAGKVELPLSLTHQTLASLVGLSRETTAMEMSALKKQGVISYAQQSYTIQLDKLLDIIGEDSFRNVQIANT